MSISDLDFTVSTFKILLSDAKSDIVYSPYSVFSCLLAAALIAEPRSQNEIFKTLSISSQDALPSFLARFKSPDKYFPPSFPKFLELFSNPKLSQTQKYELLDKFSKGDAEKDIQNLLKTKSQDVISKLSDYIEFELKRIPTIIASNQLWLNEIFFKEGMKEAKLVKFPQPGCDTINKFVEEETEGLIKNLVSPSSVSSQTTLVLTNTVYFKGSWQTEFTESLTKKDNFFLLDGTTKQVDFMKKMNAKFNYYENEEVQVLILPYQMTDFVFAVFLPKSKSGADFLKVSTLITDNLFNFVEKTKQESVNVTLPKFKSEWGASFVDILKKIGIKNAFSGSDFYGSYISDVVHKAVIIVDEKGTEAAAATAIMMTRCLIHNPQSPIEFVADHPFIYSILSPAQKNILFIGAYLSPKSS